MTTVHSRTTMRLLPLAAALLVYLFSGAAVVNGASDDYSCTSDQSGTCANNNGHQDRTETAISTSGISKNTNEIVEEGETSYTECGVWVAESTLPGTGIGMFAGQDFRKGDPMLDYGDHIVPIVDLDAKDSFFLWTEYTWNSDYFGMSRMGVNSVEVASAGFGAAANSFMDFVNVKEEEAAKYSVPDGIHRSKDPEAGAFTYHHSRNSFADDHIRAGQELFVSYGDKWFKGRKHLIGPVPIAKDHEKAENLRVIFEHKLLNRRPKLKHILEEVWDTFVADPGNDFWESSILAALPAKEDYERMGQIGLVELKRRKMVRSKDWLEEHALCADNFYFGVSSISKAGHGAFAKRKLKKGAAILPVPLIHIPNRSVLEIQDPVQEDPTRRRKPEAKAKRQEQLLVNYCLGHANSTMLLSPYGPAFNLINHNQKRANVKLQWALPRRSNHFPEMLEKDPTYFADIKSAKLALEVIALRDIEPDEEILLDYGGEWEAAWQEHLASWEPLPGSDGYISAEEMNRRPERLRTEFEQIFDPYPTNLALVIKEKYRHEMGAYKDEQGTGFKNVIFSMGDSSKFTYEILSAKTTYRRTVYTAVVAKGDVRDGSDVEMILLENLPREAFEFQDRPHTADNFLPNAFRHDIRIPDGMFPEAWKNRLR